MLSKRPAVRLKCIDRPTKARHVDNRCRPYRAYIYISFESSLEARERYACSINTFGSSSPVYYAYFQPTKEMFIYIYFLFVSHCACIIYEWKLFRPCIIYIFEYALNPAVEIEFVPSFRCCDKNNRSRLLFFILNIIIACARYRRVSLVLFQNRSSFVYKNQRREKKILETCLPNKQNKYTPQSHSE